VFKISLQKFYIFVNIRKEKRIDNKKIKCCPKNSAITKSYFRKFVNLARQRGEAQGNISENLGKKALEKSQGLIYNKEQ
jgi:hypothetical protein